MVLGAAMVVVNVAGPHDTLARVCGFSIGLWGCIDVTGMSKHGTYVAIWLQEQWIITLIREVANGAIVLLQLRL
jgi:hypothetical protein